MSAAEKEKGRKTGAWRSVAPIAPLPHWSHMASVTSCSLRCARFRVFVARSAVDEKGAGAALGPALAPAGAGSSSWSSVIRELMDGGVLVGECSDRRAMLLVASRSKAAPALPQKFEDALRAPVQHAAAQGAERVALQRDGLEPRHAAHGGRQIGNVVVRQLQPLQLCERRDCRL